MPNLSKIADPRFWTRWRKAGAVATIVAGKTRRQIPPPVEIPRSDRSRSDEMAGFGMLLNALFGRSADGDTGESFPRSDADDFARGARFVPGEVTLARRAGQKVTFVATCTSCCWYWQMPDGSRIYHYDPITADILKTDHNGVCPRCKNPHTQGGTFSAEQIAATTPKAAGGYRTAYTEDVINRHSRRPNLTGFDPQTLVRDEEVVQRSVAESAKWLVARRVNPRGDARDQLEALGFTVVREHDDLFYEVRPPAGWTKDTDGYWTTIKDASGKERIQQFFKGAVYDRDAFMNVH